jgi:protein SCO1/2
MTQITNLKNPIAYLLLVLTIVLAFAMPFLLTFFSNKSEFYGLYVGRDAKEFSLQGTNGQALELKDLAGHYSYLMFGFSNCQHVCPMQVGNLLNLRHHIQDKPVRYLFVSLDPQRDTKDVLKKYFEAYGDEFLALRPDTFQQAQALAMEYHEFAFIDGRHDPESHYDINHSGYIFLIDPQGVLKLIYTSTQLNTDKMADDLNQLIAQN